LERASNMARKGLGGWSLEVSEVGALKRQAQVRSSPGPPGTGGTSRHEIRGGGTLHGHDQGRATGPGKDGAVPTTTRGID
jgi:hypothetical protein